MGWYIARRLAAALVTVWIVATAGFLLVEIIPGDPARQLAGPGASAESLMAIREAYGFDDPLPVYARLRAESPVPVGERSILPGWIATALVVRRISPSRSTVPAKQQNEICRQSAFTGCENPN